MNPVATHLSTLTLGQHTQSGALGVLPLLATAPGSAGPPFYDTLGDAVRAGHVRVTEISEGGSVPDLRVVNDGPRPVLLVDGEELVGAKQNRIVNITILVAAGTSVHIPVSCVEAGRWSYATREFAPADRAFHATGRRAKLEQVSFAMRTSESRRADQSAVWTEIAMKSSRLGTESATRAAAAMFERSRDALEGFIAALSPLPGQVGAVFVVRDAVAGLDIFDHPATWARAMPALVRSYGLDALDPGLAAEASDTSPEEFVAALRDTPFEQFAAIGLGRDLRLQGSRAVGGALVVDDAVVHLVAFPAGGGKFRRRASVRAT